jgi:hypothetical protein
MEKYEQMASLSNRFAQQASHLAQVIITELNMKDKLVQPIEDGIGLDGRPKPVGQAGGIKFRMRCVFPTRSGPVVTCVHDMSTSLLLFAETSSSSLRLITRASTATITSLPRKLQVCYA